MNVSMSCNARPQIVREEQHGIVNAVLYRSVQIRGGKSYRAVTPPDPVVEF